MQVAFADRLIVNKRDLVTAVELAALTLELRSINALATVCVTEHARVALKDILGIHAFDFRKGRC